MLNIYQDADWNSLKDAVSGSDDDKCRDALIKIRDIVIGSNKQKGALISHNLVPVLLNTCILQEKNIERKINALIILGSLAKGSEDQIEILVRQYKIVPILMKEVLSEYNDRKRVEICLTTLRSIYEHSNAPRDDLFSDPTSLTHFLKLASADSTLKTQICVMSILVSSCQSHAHQIQLLQAGTIHILARMICFDNEDVQIPALHCLACMVFNNRSVADNVCVTSYQGRSLPDILNSLLSRLFSPELQLFAARCLTYIYRSGTLPPTDYRILHKALPTLARLCTDHFEQSTRVAASGTLAYLIEVDSELQRTAAITNHLLKSLSDLLQSHQPLAKQAALKCFASLGANDETIRKRIMDIFGLIDSILDGLQDRNTQVKLASIRCIHSLSRSVQQLRTTFQDYTIWKPLLALLLPEPPVDILIAVTSTICNLILEFSPSKEPMFNSGIVESLCQYSSHPEPALRLNSIWALMNMSFQADLRVKTDIINTMGPKRILELLCDSDTGIVMKTLGLFRNLLSQSHHIDVIMNMHSAQVLDAVNMILESNHSSEVKEQALCVIGNIAAEAQNGDYIIYDKKIMTHLGDFLFHPDKKLQAGALFAINNIVHREDSTSAEKYSRLTELDIIKNVYELNKKTVRNKALCEDYICRTLEEIVSHFKELYPEISP